MNTFKPKHIHRMQMSVSSSGATLLRGAKNLFETAYECQHLDDSQVSVEAMQQLNQTKCYCNLEVRACLKLQASRCPQSWGKSSLTLNDGKPSLQWLASPAQVSQRSCFFKRLVRSSDRLRVSLRFSCHSTIVSLPGCILAFCSHRSYKETDEVVSNKKSSLSAIVVKSLVIWSTLLFKRLANQVKDVRANCFCASLLRT